MAGQAADNVDGSGLTSDTDALQLGPHLGAPSIRLRFSGKLRPRPAIRVIRAIRG